MRRSWVALLAMVIVFVLMGSTLAEAAPYDWGKLRCGGMTEEELDAYWFQKHLERGEEAKSERGVFYDDLISALLSLQRGDVKRLYMAGAVADYIIAQNPGVYTSEIVDESFGLALSMAVLESNTELLDKLNLALLEVNVNGTLGALDAEYLTDLTKQPISAEIPIIEGAETIRVLVTGDMPPFDYITPDGKAAGYNIALLSAISAELGMNIELVYGNAGSRFINLTSGNVDAVFWTYGDTDLEEGTNMPADYSADAPKGVVATQWYTIQPNCVLYLKDAE